MSFPKFSIRGIVYEVGPRNTSAGGYVWRELVITDGDPRWPQYLPVSFGRERADLLDAVHVGELVDVEFALRGRLSAEGRAYAQLAGLAVAEANLAPPGAHEPAPTASAPVGAPPLEAPPGSPGAPAEDLPF